MSNTQLCSHALGRLKMDRGSLSLLNMTDFAEYYIQTQLFSKLYGIMQDFHGAFASLLLDGLTDKRPSELQALLAFKMVAGQRR